MPQRLVLGFLLLRRDHTKSSLTKESISLRLAYSSEVHYHDSGKHGGVQTDMALEKELRVLNLDLKAAEAN